MKIITKDKISTYSWRAPSPQAGLRYISDNFRLTPPISVINIIRLADLPPPEIEYFNANPLEVQPNSKTTLSWKVDNSTQVTVEKREVGSSSGEYINTDLPSEGSLTINVPLGTDYTLKGFFYGKTTASRYVSVAVTTTVTGYSGIEVLNSHEDERTIFVWIRDRSTSIWEEKGTLELGQSMSIELQDKHAFEFVAIDPGLLACSGNHPDESGCQRLWNPLIPGDKDGPIYSIEVE